ncbi:DMT family transporter [Paracoccus aestuariivivens]|uniref:EamA family transporter n=1 Tax=Paracoccus aestuariivivens TaxID=1820333 RepID=A0A6L6JCB0_9RHOB|nr:DMT family transporter [Paracoccus aestuariivivens]MTH79126.1 EamA family transporter [Paracoccus aestuariivivens]
MLRLLTVTALAMLGFAANSILNRLALATAEADALGYTGIRLASGAIALTIILALRTGRDREPTGSRAGAAALFGYALFFSIGYLMLAAGTGALILFASVQAGMLFWSVRSGERLSPAEWVGFALAFACFILLASPGFAAPDPLGLGLMVIAGLCWAAYSLLGRGSRDSLADTTGNFLLCLPFALGLTLIGMLLHPPSLIGWACAIGSGAVASGIGYTLWYAALPHFSRTTAAFIQLTVPVAATVGGNLFLSEPVTLRVILASTGVLGGVAMAVHAAELRRRRARSFAPDAP